MISLKEFIPGLEWQYKARLIRERPRSSPDLDSGTMMQIAEEQPEDQNPRLHKFNH